MIRLLNLGRLHFAMRNELATAITNVIHNSAFVKGRYVERFERAWADYVGVRHCVGVNSGTDGIRLILEAAGATSKSYEVIVPANTAFPTVEAVLQAGATPVFVDCGEDYVLDVAHTKSLVRPYTRAIIAVHQYGQPCDMDEVRLICEQYGLFLIEDCAHAHGAEYWRHKVGSIGDAAAWSFNAVKVLGAMGDAGGVTTDDEGLMTKCRQLADHGRREKYVHEDVGYNSRLDGLQAAILSAKLAHLDEWVHRRNVAAGLYRWYLQDAPVVLPIERERVRHAYHQFVIRVADRDRIRHKLREKGIETGIHYPLALPDQPALEPYKSAEVPRAQRYAGEILSLPMNESITREEVERVCQTLIALIS